MAALPVRAGLTLLLAGLVADNQSVAQEQCTGRTAFNTYGDSLYVVGANGSNLRLLTANGYCSAFSPDGTRLAFQERGHGGNN